jgi:Uncharacterised nucleotidyltransferase/Sulfotransferase family
VTGVDMSDEIPISEHAFPFFVGAARSGTTLLRAMVDTHPDMAIPPESWFITELASQRQRYETRRDFDIKRFATDLIANHWFARWDVAEGDLYAALHEAAPGDYPGAIRTVFSWWAARHGKSRYGDKTPGYVTELAILAALFPEACIVHLIRDGRDVALSYSETFGISTVKAIRLWRSRVRAARETGRALGVERYREIRYEDLLADPASTLRDVCSFVGIPFSDRMLCHSAHAQHLLTRMPDRHHHLHIGRPLTTGLRDWRTQMSPAVARACESLAGDLLDELGYERGPAGHSLRGNSLVAKLYLERGAQHVRATVTEHAEARRGRSLASSAPRVSDPPIRSGPPWPDPLQRSLLRVAFLERDQAVEEWRSLGGHLVLDDIWDAETHRLLPLVYRRLVQLSVEDPELPRLRGLHRRAWYENQLNLSRLAPFLARLEDAGIPAMVIKGVPLALRFYGDLGSRPMNDVDVLVPTDRMGAALRLLEADGWRSHRDRRGRSQPLTEGFSLMSDHSRIVAAPDGFFVDLHWHLREQFVVPGQEMTSSDDFWRAAEPIDILGVATRTLCASDLLLHAVVHGLVSQRDARARWAADSLAVIRHSEAVDWERLIQQAKQRRLVLILRAALWYLVDSLQAEVPVDVLTSLDGVPTTLGDERAFRRALRRDDYGPRLQGLFDLGPVWEWRRAHLGTARAVLDLPHFLRDAWQLSSTKDVPLEAARHLADRARRHRGTRLPGLTRQL